ncbi:hypothetical protein WA026_006743 [Henosepilachna vigintioctopunctata]|uniref:Uncharacterized protein n=1 Tax=Henosepilachna vigintioctopunctata TaxID=420089 RepID=A0AAW1UAK5_9CUCU
MTLKRYVRKRKEATTEQIDYTPNYRQSQNFSITEESELVNYLLKASKLYHGLTAKNLTNQKKIVTCNGVKQVSMVTSGERGQLLNVCAAINAIGNHLTNSSSVSENEANTNASVTSGDWVIVNMVSQRNLVHRYIGQVHSRSRSGYDIKFAKKMNDIFFKWPAIDDISIIAEYPNIYSKSEIVIKKNLQL